MKNLLNPSYWFKSHKIIEFDAVDIENDRFFRTF